MCVFDECDTPFETYSSSREWLSHMRSQHRMRWHCFATSHEASFFESPDVLEQHLRDVHANQFSGEEISFLVENSSHPSLSVIEDCPFCQLKAENTEEDVARHLIQLALRSLPWPEDCYSSYHPSQSSRSSHSEGTASSADSNRDEDGMLEFRETDWDAWEKKIQAEDNSSHPLRNPGHEEPHITGEISGMVGLHDFMNPKYDAAEDELLEPFQQRANLDAVKHPSAETQLSERQVSMMNFMKEEATLIRELQVLAEIYKKTSEAVSKLDQVTIDRLLRNLDQLINLHEGLLEDLRMVSSSRWTDTRIPISRVETISSLSTASESIGPVFLENFRKLGPAHEAYDTTHEGATSLWHSLRGE